MADLYCWFLVPFVLTLLIAGCSSSDTDLWVSWSFVDGGDCAERNIEEVTIRLDDGVPLSVPCEDGFRNAIHLGTTNREYQRLEIEGISGRSGVVYRLVSRIDSLDGGVRRVHLVLPYAI